MNIKRLEHLRTIMLNLYENDLRAKNNDTIIGFDLSGWIDEVPADVFGRVDVRHKDCGAVACAMGHAALDPEFNKQGLTLSEEEDGEYGEPEYRLDADSWAYSGWEAATEFFDIKGSQSRWLFDNDNYPHTNVTPLDVAKRITEMLKENDND